MEKSRKKELILISIGIVLYFFANVQRAAIPGAIFDVLQVELNTTAPYITAFGACFMYIYAICQLFIGILVDRYSGNRIIAIGSIFFFIGSLIFPIATSLKILYLSRLLVGLGASSIYLSLIKEIKSTFSSANFGLVLSIALLIGYVGGIFANAPFVMLVKAYGWRETLFSIGIITSIFSIIFVLIFLTTKKTPINKEIKLNFEPFKIVLKNKKNINIYTFAVLNYGMYYVLQTCIGMKFLQDFCLITIEKASLILSIMAGLYAIAGSILAFLSKIFYTRKAIFLRIIGGSTLVIYSTIAILLIFNIKATILIAVLLFIMAASASLSPLLVPLLHDTNEKFVSGTSVSFMTCLFALCVGILGNITGILMNLFPTEKLQTGLIRYDNNSYLLIFVLFIILSIISLINVLKIQDSKKTKRLIAIKHADIHIHIGW
jgi:MFS family permease